MELAYIAGLFDAEGCVRIARRHRYGGPGDARKRCEMYYLEVRVTNLDPRLVYPLKERFGGCVNVQPVPAGQRPTFVWVASTQKALGFLLAVRPWLISKAEQVDIAVAFQQAKRRVGKPKGGVPAAVKQRERDQYAAIAALKYRTYDPVGMGMVANSGELQNGQPRAKQALQ
jgi:hypothetical protein